MPLITRPRLTNVGDKALALASDGAAAISPWRKPWDWETVDLQSPGRGDSELKLKKPSKLAVAPAEAYDVAS